MPSPVNSSASSPYFAAAARACIAAVKISRFKTMPLCSCFVSAKSFSMKSGGNAPWSTAMVLTTAAMYICCCSTNELTETSNLKPL